MKTYFLKVFAAMLVLALPFSVQSFADENEVVALKNMVDVLSNKVNTLEKRVAASESAPAGSVATYAPSPTGTSEGTFLRTSQPISMGGHIDTQWNNNFRQPATAGTAANNTGRIFDTNDGSFVVNMAELWFEKPVEEPKEAGFRLDIAMGNDSAVVNGDGDGDRFDLQQAYIQYIAPLGFFEGSEVLPDDIKIMAGRFVTLAGKEVIEAQGNWNISRSYMFGLGIPFTHTGVRTQFGLFQDWLTMYAGINNGWDLNVDNNSFKTFEWAASYSPIDNVTLTHTIYWGGEVADTVGGKRFLNTNVVDVAVTDKLSVAGELNYAHQNDVDDSTSPAGSLPDGTDSDWWGFAGYARYQLTDKLAVAYRGEIFVDDEVFRNGQVGTAAGTFQSDRTFEQTITAEYKVTEQMIARAEFRHDKSNDDGIFGTAGTTTGKSGQTSVGAQLIYLI